MSELTMIGFLPQRLPNTPISCAVCGCRLMADADLIERGWRHLPSLQAGRDARGCRPHCVAAVRDVEGRVLVGASAAAAAL